MGDVRKYLSLLASTQETLVELGKMKELIDKLASKQDPELKEDAAMAAVMATVVDLRAVLLERICDDDVMREAGGMYAIAAASSVAVDRPE